MAQSIWFGDPAFEIPTTMSSCVGKRPRGLSRGVRFESMKTNACRSAAFHRSAQTGDGLISNRSVRVVSISETIQAADSLGVVPSTFQVQTGEQFWRNVFERTDAKTAGLRNGRCDHAFETIAIFKTHPRHAKLFIACRSPNIPSSPRYYATRTRLSKSILLGAFPRFRGTRRPDQLDTKWRHVMA